MKLVVWNIAKGSARNLPRLRELAPDLAVVPECHEDLDLSGDVAMTWCGQDPKADLAVLGFGGVSVEQALHTHRELLSPGPGGPSDHAPLVVDCNPPPRPT